MPIIITEKGKNAIKVDKNKFENESDLQKYIYDNPESLPLEDIKENIKFIAIDREFNTVTGPLDIIGFDNEGEIYIIETKLYKNNDKRRVIAQVLDYGASLWNSYQNPEEFLIELRRRFKEKNNIELEEKLEKGFGEHDELIKNIKNNLTEGKFNFIILMDEIDSSLKNLISFMNQNSLFRIYGVELEYYVLKNYEILIPHFFGVETRKHVVSISKLNEKISDEEFFQKLEKQSGEEESKIARKILEWAKEKGFDIQWPGISFGLEIKYNNINYKLLKVYSNGAIELSFAYLKKSPPFDNDSKRLELLKHFNQISSFPKLSDDKIHARPGDGLSVSMLKKEKDYQEFLNVLEWFLKEINCNKILNL